MTSILSDQLLHPPLHQDPDEVGEDKVLEVPLANGDIWDLSESHNDVYVLTFYTLEVASNLTLGWNIHKTAKTLIFRKFLSFSDGSRPLYVLDYPSVIHQIKAQT